MITNWILETVQILIPSFDGNFQILYFKFNLQSLLIFIFMILILLILIKIGLLINKRLNKLR